MDPMPRARAAWTAFTHRPPGCDSHWLTRTMLLRLFGFVYFVAFLSLAHQVLPLLGSDGLLPVEQRFERWRAHFGDDLRRFAEVPSIFWFDHSDGFLLGMAWTGVALSLPVMAGYANVPWMTVLWALYLSFVHVGQAWFAFGWELQMSETGFLAIFLVPLLDPRPFPARPPPVQVIWLYRWLIARMMLGAGLIKLRGDDCWVELTCLCTHYETQPIPNPISRVLHAMPVWFHQLGCAFNHVVELIVPFFAFGPPRARRVAGILFLVFQFLLLGSGNLSFLNVLTMVPALACLDDGMWRRLVPARWSAAAERAAEGARATAAQRIAAWTVTGLVAFLSLPPVANLIAPDQIMNLSFNSLYLVNSYGAFGAVDSERIELVVQGTTDEAPGPDTVWREYEFKAKPTDLRRRPPFVAPYHYRLDWLVWFAHRGPPERHPWLVHLVWKLLHNDPGALGLLAGNPFPEAPPRWIRVERYVYRFTPLGAGAYWSRTRRGAWLKPVSNDDFDLLLFLSDRGWHPDQVAERKKR